jgi:putative ABC transport system ATP-binding protein
MVLNATGLRKRFGTGDAAVAVLDGISLTAAEGEFLAITGPSGSGKSTLLAILAGLERPSAGEVWLAGRCLAALDDAALARLRRRQVGFVFQSFNLVPVLSVEENVALPFLLDGAPHRQFAPRVADALESVGLSHRRRHLPDQISVGERQRAALARALAVRPRVLFADEPTGSLDSQRGQTVLTLLRAAAAQGCAVVMVTHDAGAAASANRVLRICDGRVEAPPPVSVAAC